MRHPNWIFLVVLLGAGHSGFSQFHKKANAHVQLRSLGFVQGTNQFNGALDHCGIYSSEGDRQSGQLSLAIECRREDHKIKRGFIQDQLAIKIVRKNGIDSYLHRDIYGYRDCNGKEYHFFDGKTYELVNPGEAIPIYRTHEPHGKQRFTKFFFADDDGEIRALTLANLNEEFAHEPLFLEKLQILANNNLQLTRYLHLINRVRQNALHGGEYL